MALEWCNGFKGDMGPVLGLHGSGFQGTTLMKSCNNKIPVKFRDHHGSKKPLMIASSILAELLLVPSEEYRRQCK